MSACGCGEGGGKGARAHDEEVFEHRNIGSQRQLCVRVQVERWRES